ncbi:hypothetical protein [Marinifilum fragile]|uniref:hypothetical protein n=1 Tax=Marinifilum fragile TaxID=570161 RepID=UPI0012F7C7DE|nr:hypothetical protein [Marinifilum fragile]
MKLYLKVALVLFVMVSCKIDPNKQIDEGKINENTYYSKEIGWTMEIPKGWKITHRSELERRSKKGIEALSETAGIEYDASGLKQLLNLQKDRFHIFQSTSDPFKLEYEGEWEENNKAVQELLYETYSSRGIKVDTSSSKEIIDNLEFQVIHVTLYGPDGKIILYQDMYGRHINGCDFGVNLNYINDKEKSEMLNAWKNSKFK